jgi:hypothetical protein
MKYHGKNIKFLRPSVYAISKETLYKLPSFPPSGLLKTPKSLIQKRNIRLRLQYLTGWRKRRAGALYFET